MNKHIRIMSALFFILPNLTYGSQLIDNVIVAKNQITVIPHESIKKTFLKDQNVIVTYDQNVDISGIPRSVLTIPFLMSISPIIWLIGEHWIVEEMDQDVYSSLCAIKEVFKIFYPNLVWAGSITPTKLVKNSSQKALSSDYTALLFSCGLDSVASSFKHHDKKQLLITNHGVDVPLSQEDMWLNVRSQCERFGRTYNHTNAFIRCNFCAIVNYAHLLSIAPIGSKWWWLDNVVDALNHTGVTAPLLFLNGYKQLLIAASHTETFPFPYGSHPLIDNKISFAGITVHHDLALTRCEKVKLINALAQRLNLPKPLLRVCWTDKQGNNCLNCEKCLRTLNNILAVGENPCDYGFALTTEEIMQKTHAFFAQDPVKDSKIFWEWSTTQDMIKESLHNQNHGLSPLLTPYLRWLSHVKLDGQHSAKIHEMNAQLPFFKKLWLAEVPPSKTTLAILMDAITTKTHSDETRILMPNP